MKQLIICITSLFFLMEAHAQLSEVIEASVKIEIAPASCEIAGTHELDFGELTRPAVGSATATMDPTVVTTELDLSDELSYTLDADNSVLNFSGQPILGRFYVQPLNATRLMVELLSTPPALDYEDPSGVTYEIPYSLEWSSAEQFYGAFTRLNTSNEEFSVDHIVDETEGVYFRIGGSLSQITPELPPEIYDGEITVQIMCE